jgi:hypothetical protein
MPRGPIRTNFGIADHSEFAHTPKAMLHRAEQRLEQARVGNAVLAMF